ncbi:hypothetical protein CS006_02530 [Bifidobacterium primatium]|uniref:Phosphotyrosine protein phosphatase I domain-containing protein n=2 Tax=Bifidobacterium TaxID=1678 RepID=A0A2M9HB78_9BIFI|nr:MULTISPECIES: hypothetical protein [Bifidobacterium]NEG95337.1 hypothetical protein [Bifidobacterium sp. SMB2]NEH11479.1 hypothetical protein [Bifidobacterium saimiriisciurei]PJM74041.1 hypothetical protein CS006_02530 [Bifidobacterium primatium]
MHVLMVCSGNVCRSPMAEYMLRDALRRRGVSDIEGEGISVSSAGLLRLPPRPMDETCLNLLDESFDAADAGRSGIDASLHESTPFYNTPYARCAGTNVLVLCFEHDHIDEVLIENPSLVRSTFLITEFAELCLAAAKRGDFDRPATFGGDGIGDADAKDGESTAIVADDAASRLLTVMRNAPFLRPGLTPAAGIPDPYHRSLNDYRNAYDAIRQCVNDIVSILP